MKKLIYLLIIFLSTLTAISVTAMCQENNFGLGLLSGEPTGISFKQWMDENTAVDGGLAWSFIDEVNLHAHADWLTHNWSFLKNKFGVEEGEIPLYYGIGGRIKFGDDTRAGARFVIGFAYIFDNAPFDIFFEIAPVLDVVPKTEINGNSAIGARYWFD